MKMAILLRENAFCVNGFTHPISFLKINHYSFLKQETSTLSRHRDNYYWKNDNSLIFKQEMNIYVVMLLISYLIIDHQSIFQQGMSESENSTRPRSDFIYTKNSARPRSDYIIIYIYTRIPRGRDLILPTQRRGGGDLEENGHFF